MTFKSVGLTALALSTVIASASLVQAQINEPPGPGNTRGITGSCATDIKKYCSGMRGRDAVSCLQSNSSQISSQCKTAVAAAQAPGGMSGPVGGANNGN
jgi:hypothetical protein